MPAFMVFVSGERARVDLQACGGFDSLPFAAIFRSDMEALILALGLIVFVAMLIVAVLGTIEYKKQRRHQIFMEYLSGEREEF